MKAYVIKNKEGKYKTESVGVEIQSYFLRDIRCAEIFTDKEVAKSFCPSDCEVVEITIAEGDLEQKMAVLERALKNTCWLLYGTYDEHYPSCFIKQAEKELKEMG